MLVSNIAAAFDIIVLISWQGTSLPHLAWLRKKPHISAQRQNFKNPLGYFFGVI